MLNLDITTFRILWEREVCSKYFQNYSFVGYRKKKNAIEEPLK